MVVDDLPWPELGNVTRGATRGNQGQKGVLGPPDSDGRSILQLRVQPGVLAVRLNRQASDWYRTLDGEVNRALKLTKTYWRKARRRQDYDARADQDHMELHEWLQQLKDKTMSHLELLMQKGDIQGPPYAMPDDVELPFLRQFIERHNAGIPHNPRLRETAQRDQMLHLDETVESVSSETPDISRDIPSIVNKGTHSSRDVADAARLDFYSPGPSGPRMVPLGQSSSYSAQNLDTLVQAAYACMQKLQDSRSVLSRAQKETQDAFRKYSACLDAERQVLQDVATAEKRRDDTMFLLLSHCQSTEVSSRHSSTSLDEHHSPPQQHHGPVHRHHREHGPSSDAIRPNGENENPPNWSESDGTAIYSMETNSEFQLAAQSFQDQHPAARKHPRDWEQNQHVQNSQPNCEDLSVFVPRKRMHQIEDTFDGLSNVPISHVNNSIS